MFLAINELIREKSRFVLITFVIVLVSYLVFFLTALAYGLATSYTQGIDKWQASGIVLDEAANGNLARSLLVSSDYEELLTGDAAILGISNSTIDVDEPEDVAVFGINTDDVLVPAVTEGRSIDSEREVILADDLAVVGIELDQSIRFKGSETEFKVVGFTDKATYQTAPIVYMDVSEWRSLSSEIAGMSAMRDDSTVNAVVTFGEFDESKLGGTNLTWQSIQDYSRGLPGYNAQVLTFSTMIGFLIAIASFVLAIFMYILTLQKKSIFGVLKAEGVPNSYIALSVILQTVILSASGMAIGLALTLISGAFLGSMVPFMVQPLFFVTIILLFLVFAVVGALASVRAVTKIDPVEAIG